MQRRLHRCACSRLPACLCMLVSFSWRVASSASDMNARLLQVSTLMWLHTTLNYQYKYGTGIRPTVTALWREGGIPRFYRGFGYALCLSPATRFLDTAANAGCLSLLESHSYTADLPLAAKTLCGSAVASVARLALMPLDVMKTTQQVEGSRAAALIRGKYRHGGPKILFHGALASTTSSMISHFPWFYTVLPFKYCSPCPNSLSQVHTSGAQASTIFHEVPQSCCHLLSCRVRQQRNTSKHKLIFTLATSTVCIYA